MNVLGLFSGIGGFELGLRNAGFNISKICEIDTNCKKVLSKNFENIELISDVKNINKDTGYFDVICGGFPCTDISIAGKNNGGLYGEKSGLWFEFERIIDEIRPKYAIVENVYALRSRGLETVLYNLSSIGYDATWTTLDSQFFGSPQRRRRVYIVGVRDGIPRNTDLFRNKGRSTPECRKQVQHIEKKRRWYFEEGKGKWNKIAFFTRQRSDEFQEIGLSSTLAKRDYKSFTDIVYESNDNETRLRRVTPKERLLIQGFPEYWLDGLNLSDSDMYKMNGMSVKTVKFIGECIINFNNTL